MRKAGIDFLIHSDVSSLSAVSRDGPGSLRVNQSGSRWRFQKWLSSLLWVCKLTYKTDVEHVVNREIHRLWVDLKVEFSVAHYVPKDSASLFISGPDSRTLNPRTFSTSARGIEVWHVGPLRIKKGAWNDENKTLTTRVNFCENLFQRAPVHNGHFPSVYKKQCTS